MSINQLYSTWFQRVGQLWPDERITRLRNFAWLVVGISLSRSVRLRRIAGKIISSAKLTSLPRRLSRLLDNPAVRVREWYAPLAREVLPSMANTLGEIRLLADGSTVGFGHQLLIVAVAFRRRAIPIAWTWVRSPKGHSSAYKPLALLASVRGLLPPGGPVLLVGDNELGAVEVLRQLDAWGWKYVVRQKGSPLLRLEGRKEWQPFGELISGPGQSLWLGCGLLTAQFAYPVNWAAHGEGGEKEPWLLATNLPTLRATLKA